MRRNRNRFAAGQLETMVLHKLIENPGLYGSALSDLLFPDPREGGYHNRIIVIDRLNSLERKGLVRFVTTKVPSPHGRRIAKLAYPTEKALAGV